MHCFACRNMTGYNSTKAWTVINQLLTTDRGWGKPDLVTVFFGANDAALKGPAYARCVCSCYCFVNMLVRGSVCLPFALCSLARADSMLAHVHVPLSEYMANLRAIISSIRMHCTSTKSMTRLSSSSIRNAWCTSTAVTAVSLSHFPSFNVFIDDTCMFMTSYLGHASASGG